MPWSRRDHMIVAVSFFEKGKHAPFAGSQVPVDQLPNDFRISTTVTIEGNEWHVVRAVPETKDEFVQTGRLSLVLEKIVMMNPKDLLFCHGRY